MSWISLILFPALLYCHLLNVELRHNVDGVPRQLCTLPTTPRFTCPHFPSLAFVPFPSASSFHIFPYASHKMSEAAARSIPLIPVASKNLLKGQKATRDHIRCWFEVNQFGESARKIVEAEACREGDSTKTERANCKMGAESH